MIALPASTQEQTTRGKFFFNQVTNLTLWPYITPKLMSKKDEGLQLLSYICYSEFMNITTIFFLTEQIVCSRRAARSITNSAWCPRTPSCWGGDSPFKYCKYVSETLIPIGSVHRLHCTLASHEGCSVNGGYYVHSYIQKIFRYYWFPCFGMLSF